jgi:preprotein translocase subunit SecA
MQRLFLTGPIYKNKEEIPNDLTQDELFDILKERAIDFYTRKENIVTPKRMRHLERLALLQSIDKHWKEHLYEMDQLKEGINLRAYGQKDPLLEYKSEGFRTFTERLSEINTEVVELIIKAQLREEAPMTRRKPQREMREEHASATGMGFVSQQGAAQSGQSADQQKIKKTPVVAEEKVGRNDPCPCGSGKKYKKCHGR